MFRKFWANIVQRHRVVHRLVYLGVFVELVIVGCNSDSNNTSNTSAAQGGVSGAETAGKDVDTQTDDAPLAQWSSCLDFSQGYVSGYFELWPTFFCALRDKNLFVGRIRVDDSRLVFGTCGEIRDSIEYDVSIVEKYYHSTGNNVSLLRVPGITWPKDEPLPGKSTVKAGPNWSYPLKVGEHYVVICISNEDGTCGVLDGSSLFVEQQDGSLAYGAASGLGPPEGSLANGVIIGGEAELLSWVDPYLVTGDACPVKDIRETLDDPDSSDGDDNPSGAD